MGHGHELGTKRLRLRRWREADRTAFAQMNADPEVMEQFPAPLTRRDSDLPVDRVEAGFEQHGFGLWAIEVVVTGQFVGFTGMSVPGFEAHSGCGAARSSRCRRRGSCRPGRCARAATPGSPLFQVDRDGKYPALIDQILADAGITVVRSGVRMPRMNAIMERSVRTCRRELLDRTLIWNQRHLLQVLREFEIFYNEHRPHQGIANARPLAPLPDPITDSDRLAHLHIHRRDRLGGILHEYEHAA
ncbi:GNAT family N-acetyltransferase [Micromonospora sp. NPDC005305]|uniref:GNAT family N-acetyltransferase n=1 Tax=Micromonospora sp. NPDC005305 TaxID=3156875 RepID=UPI0033AE6DBD